MPKKKQKKRNTVRTKPSARQNTPLGQGSPGTRQSGHIQLSQCMIVKDEEKNIEKALSWGKGIVCEQIVVDTGSTDRTIEIAERHGAKVLHFEWINDFAAAKNYALEHANGDWIAFLDADEYFPGEEAAKILPILRQVEDNPAMRKKYAIVCPMHQLNDKGETMEVNAQARLFKNTPKVRYKGRIHEELNIGAPEIIRTEDIKIMHTGYSESANVGTGKSMRNIAIIKNELEQNPNDLRMKMYLADSLVSHSNEMLAQDEKADTKTFLKEAEALYKEVISDKKTDIDDEFRRASYRYLLRQYRDTPGKNDEYEQISESAYTDYPDDHKIACLYAAIQNKNENYQKAFEVLKKLEAKQSSKTEHSFGYSIVDLTQMCKEFIIAAQGLGDIDSVMNYTTVLLTADKTNTAILGIYIKILIQQLPSYDSVLEILGMIYDLNNYDDRVLIADAARACGAVSLAGLLEQARM